MTSLTELRYPHLLIVLALGLGVTLRLLNLSNVGSRTSDEVTYTRQANVWLQHGRAGIRSLVAEYQRDSVVRYSPMPTRAGMIRLLAATMQWTGRRDQAVGALVSCAASIASLALLVLIGIRFMPPLAALVAVFFHAVFPPELVIARRTWTDALVELSALVLVWITCEIVRDSSRKVWYFAFALVGGLSITLKESMPVPYAICGAWLLWVLLKQRRERANALFLTAAVAVGIVVSVWWMATMAGSLSDLVSIVTGISGVNALNPYALEFATGPGYLLLDGLWIVSPSIALFSLVGLLAVIKGPRELDDYRVAVMWIALFTLSNVAIAMIVPHWLNLRYISVAFGTYCLLAGLGVWYLSLALRSSTRKGARIAFAALMGIILIGGAVKDYLYFRTIFVTNGTGDLSIKKIRDQRPGL